MNERKPRLTLLCGLSASGKSQYINTVLQDSGNEVITISTDGIRENICGRVEDQSKNKEVFQTFHSLIVKYLKNGIDVVAEATNITMKSRRSILNVIKGIDCEKVCVVIVKPIGECKKDNIDREHPVLKHVIDKQARKFQIPFLKKDGMKLNLLIIFTIKTSITIDLKIHGFQKYIMISTRRIRIIWNLLANI